MLKEIIPFNNSIYKTKFNFNWKELKPIFEKMVDVEEQDYLESGNAVTSYKNTISPFKLLELKEFYDYITPIYKDILINKWNFPSDNEYKISDGWVSKYSKGGYIKPHTHTGIVAVICSYVQLPKGASNIIFKDPYYDTKSITITKDDKWLWKEIKCKTNDVLIFQGGFMHKTEPNMIDEDRWVITNNIFIEKNKSKFI